MESLLGMIDRASAIDKRRGQPSTPVAWWPMAVNVFRSRPGPQPQIKDRQGRGPVDGGQQRVDVLTDVVVARAFKKLLGTGVVNDAS